MPQIIVYVTDYCPYCHAAIELLKKRNLSHQVVDVSDPAKKMALKAKTGWQTVPQIFIDDKLIGGYQELVALDRAGKLN